MLLKTNKNKRKFSTVYPITDQTTKQIFSRRSISEKKLNKIPRINNSLMPLKRIHPYANSLKMNSFILVLLSCATLILFYLASELVYSSNYIITRSINCLRSIIIILNIISAIMIYRYYYLILQIRKAYKEVSKASTIFNDKITRRHFLCELIIIIPSIPPMLS